MITNERELVVLHDHQTETMLQAVDCLEDYVRPAFDPVRIGYDFPGIVTVEMRSGRVYVTGAANETYTVDVYESVPYYEQGVPCDMTDLGLRTDDMTVDGDQLARVFAIAIERLDHAA